MQENEVLRQMMKRKVKATRVADAEVPAEGGEDDGGAVVEQ